MKKLIVNADDFGYSEGINDGIIKAFKEGIVTSTSLMVRESAREHAVYLSKFNPRLGLGLHFQIDMGKWFDPLRKVLPIIQMNKTKQEFLDQINEFRCLTGKMPDHVNSHGHIHQLPRLYQLISIYCHKNNIPLRGEINLIKSFYDIPKSWPLAIKYLTKILRDLPEGVSELECHPGVVSKDFKSSYLFQRELELRVLTAPEIKKEIVKLHIKLTSWKRL